MRTDELDYELPEELIAQEPVEPRDSSRLLVCRRDGDSLSENLFRDLPDLLEPGDVLVTNQARVMPARLFGYKYPSGARIEVFLLEQLPACSSGNPRYKALLKRRRRLEPGDSVVFPESALTATIIESNDEIGEDIVELGGIEDIQGEIEKIGDIPLPPYIKKYRGDSEKYQTVFAKITGSVAAPTAGLHFTPELLDKLKGKGIERVEGHLRVGWGTFSPIRAENIEDHNLHAEVGELSQDAADRLNEIRSKGGRIIAVGTTMTRLLETSVDENGIFHAFQGPTDLYITPGYEFKAVDVLLTNFHLPKTSLLALVSAFLGTETTLAAYQYAVERNFRFYSFGDAMLIT
jgi:S-adenosylmethionine:tRNA ribosyltransferase-isomerase